MPTPIRRVRRRARHAGAWILPPLTGIWLVVLWLLLWGRLSLGLIASGLVVAGIVMAMFPLPTIAIEGRPRLLPSIGFLLRFLGDVILASVQVAWLAVRPGREPQSAVIGVHLHTRSDLMLTLVAEVLSLVPGSLVVEVDRSSSILYLHVIGVRDLEQVEVERQRALDTEARLIRAFGSPTDREALERGNAR